MIIIIAAVAADRGIGRAGDLLWHISADLKHFKTLTTGSAVVMGRRTWESLPRRPLPGRLNIVVSRNPGYQADGAVVTDTLASAAQAAAAQGYEDIYIIGGGQIYTQAMPLADRLELTEIDATAPDCDTYFPAIDRAEWELTSSHMGDDAGLSYRFNTYQRKS